MTASAPTGAAGSPQPSGPEASWLRRLDTRPEGASRLICFPHAGGSASIFRTWLPGWDHAAELWAVQYPGREDRTEELLPDTLGGLAQQIALALQWKSDKPFALFGHSMGAVVAYETARRLTRLGLTAPTRLIASGSHSPDTAAERAGQEDSADDVQWLREHGADPDEELQQTAARVLTADLGLLTGYRTSPTPLGIPLTVLRNQDDPDLDGETFTSWARFTTSGLRRETLPGDHFACYERPGEILTALRDTH